MRALVLSGGGAKGAYEVGALKHLIGNLNIHYDILCGISVGALNAAFISMFTADENHKALKELLEIWNNVKTNDVYKNWFPFGKLHALWKNSVYDSRPLMKLVRSRLDLQKIRQSGRQVAVGAVSLTTGKYKLFTQYDDTFIDGVIGSSAFPAFLTPIQINGELYTDGGVKEITPLKSAIDMGAETIDVIMCSPVDTTKKFNNNASVSSLTMRTIDLMSDEIVANDLKIAFMYNDLVRAGLIKEKKEIKISIINPSIDLTDDSLDFNHDKLMKMMEIGYQDALIKFGN